MSGFLPDLASWALRGGAGEENSDNTNNNNNDNDVSRNDSAEAPLSAAELRAQRLARMELLQQRALEHQQEAEPMEVDNAVEQKPSPPRPPAPPTAPPKAKPAPQPVMATTTTPKGDSQKKKKAKSEISPAENSRKLLKKKELLLKKVLSIALTATNDASCVFVDVDSTEVSVQTIAEILATRLSMNESQLDTMPPQKPLMAYLGASYRRAGEEIKTMQQQQQSSKTTSPNELLDILGEIQRQVVSYAATCLMEPDLFELGKDASSQLAKCLLASTTDPASSITFGVSGPTSSFYYKLCDELIQQDETVFEIVVSDVCNHLMKPLAKCESVLDGVEGAEGGSAVVVSALTALCLHKRAAKAVADLPTFLLPPADSPEASVLIRPPMPTGGNLFQMLTGEHRPYKKRSGPAIEKETILGLCLRVGVPKNNAAFSPTSILRQSLDSVERATSSQRRQLRVHQDACNQLIFALVKGGPEVRTKVMTWFVDALLVNVGAAAMRPDPSKVSSTNMLLNMSVALLKLCEPFVNDESKHHLIDPGFVSSREDHGGVFASSGELSVSRLGENVEDGMVDTWNPKNSFIPQCFFLCARSLHFGIVPLLSYQENLLRHISHAHWEITSNNRDLQSDPQFSILVSKQRSNEVALFQEEMATDTLRFCNLVAKVLYVIPDDSLRAMPEDFVNDICDTIMSIAKLKPKLLRGLEFRYVFKMAVKLLSSTYASMVRNYNLRARLGDVLYELFLPISSGDRRDVPASVSTDPLAGGQTFLLADTEAQETLAPSLLLLYGEVEHTGYYDKMSHRAKISSLIKYLWQSSQHRPAFRRITQNRESFIKFANGIMNETNTLIATVMQKLPEIREAQEKMKNPQDWGHLSEDEQNQISSRLDDNEREVKHALPLCNKTMQMFGYLNTDPDIRALFLLEELCPRLVTMLIHVLTKLVGSKGLDLKVDNPEQYDFRPKEMLRDLCAIFALFATSETFQSECAKSGADPGLLRSAVKTCRRLNLLTGESMVAFETLPDIVEAVALSVAADEELVADAPDEFLDELLSTFMKDPVRLPSGHYVDRSTITQHLLNDHTDPFSREPLTIENVQPATELKERMAVWLEEKRRSKQQHS